jgi:hypothetical protein
MRSVNPERSKTQLDALLRGHNVTQVDNVKLGMLVPGGAYYNIFVPRHRMTDFLVQVKSMDEATLYETRTRGRNPPGKNKVFIWIKRI